MSNLEILKLLQDFLDDFCDGCIPLVVPMCVPVHDGLTDDHDPKFGAMTTSAPLQH